MKTKISMEQFVEKWQTSETILEVCKVLDIDPKKAGTISGNLRRHGVKLKHFPKGLKYNYKALAELAEKFAPKKNKAA